MPRRSGLRAALRGVIDLATLLAREPFKPRPDVVEWARRSVYIGAAQGTARPGFYDVTVTPYMAEPLRAMVDDETRRVVLVTGAQVGKTEAEKVATVYTLRHRPGPLMLVLPAQDDAEDFASTRLKPTLEDSPACADLIPADKKRNFGKRLLRIPGSLVYLRGAGTPGKLASVPVRTMVLDETDKYPPTFTREGSPVALIEQRMKTYQGTEKLIATSTPTTEDGVIWQQFLLGDRREFWVTCPHCGASQPLTFKDVKFDDDPGKSPAQIGATARLVCRACKAEFDSAGKDALVRDGRWEPSATPSRTGFRSYHVQAIASPWVTLERLVEEFITAKRAGPHQLRVFVNSELAEPWYEADETLQGKRLAELEADYEEGGHFPLTDVPPEGRVRLAGVDVQKDHLVVVVREFAPGGASGLVWHGRANTFAQLDDILTTHGADAAFVDAQFRTSEIVAAAVTFRGIVPCHGVQSLADGALWYFKNQTITLGRSSSGAVSHIYFDQSAVFEFVARGLNGELAWYLHRGATEDLEYTGQVTAKVKVAGRWQAPTRKTDDHYADAEKLAMLGAIVQGLMVPDVAAGMGGNAVVDSISARAEAT